MKYINVKIIIVFLTIIMFGISVYEFINTYALFYTETNSVAELQTADWVIKVNNEDITSGIEREFLLNQNTLSTVNHVREGKFAPGTTMETRIVIDPEGTDVSIKFEITIDQEFLEENDNIIFTGITEQNLNNNFIQTDVTTYTGIMNLSDIVQGQKANLRLFFNWSNLEVNNTKDTLLGTEGNFKYEIPIKIKMTQYLGETITPYQS